MRHFWPLADLLRLVLAKRPLITAVLLAGAVLCLSLPGPKDVGLYHDDGIYLASAASLENADYRLVNLPESPMGTKYPPLYPTLLVVALEGHVSTKVPAHLALAGLGFAVWSWLRRFGASRGLSAAAVLLVGINPGLLSHSNLLLSDVPFTFLCVALVTQLARADRPPTMTRACMVGLLGTAAALTREVGLVAIVAALSHMWNQWSRKATIVFAVVVTGTMLPWWLWRFAAPAQQFALLEFYVQYERQAWNLFFSDPAMGARVIWANARFYVGALGMVLGMPGVVLTAAGLVLATFGWFTHRAHRDNGPTATIVGLYLLSIVGHPYPMARYLLPLVPFYVVYFALGLKACTARIRLTGLAIALVPSLLWGITWLHFRDAAIHGGFGRAMAYGDAGFEETAAWVRRCTSPNARLASAHDPFYYLATGRPAIRPWLHKPYTYRPEYGRYLADPDPVAGVQDELDRLGVTVLVKDPLLVNGEAAHGHRSMLALLQQGTSVWRLVYATAERHHEVFERVGSRSVKDEPGCRHP